MTCDVSNWSAGHFAMSQWQKTTFSYVPALVRVPTECHGDYNKDTRCQNYRINILNQQSTAESILQQTDNVNLTQLHESILQQTDNVNLTQLHTSVDKFTVKSQIQHV